MASLRATVRDACVAAITAGDPLPLTPEVRKGNAGEVFVRHKSASRPLVLVIGGQTRRGRLDRGRWAADIDIDVIIFAPGGRDSVDDLDALDEMAQEVERRMRAAAPGGASAVEGVDGDPLDPTTLQQTRLYAHSFTVTYRLAGVP